MSRATVYEVAKKAGVSFATVSRVPNTPERVNETTRARDYQAIDQLGFVPLAEAAARARKSHGRLGVMAPFFSHPSFVARECDVAEPLGAPPCDLTTYDVDSWSKFDGLLTSLPLTRRPGSLVASRPGSAGTHLSQRQR